MKDDENEKAEHVSLVRLLKPGQKVPAGKNPNNYMNADGSEIRPDQMDSSPKSTSSAPVPESKKLLPPAGF